MNSLIISYSDRVNFKVRTLFDSEIKQTGYELIGNGVHAINYIN